MYASLPGIDVYFEDHGAGAPLVLLHGGMQTLDLSFGALMPLLTPHRRVIPIELQGHGRTADPADREVTLANQAGDVVGVLDHLGLARADVLGFSWGGYVALETALRHPDRVDRLVLAAVNTRADGYHAEIHDPEQWATSTRMPSEHDFTAMVGEYERYGISTFEAVNAKLQPIVGAEQNWTPEQLATITAPTLLMIGDHDFVRVDHAVAMQEAIPDAGLAVLPRTKHTKVISRVGLVAPLVEDFLAR
ncbi:pimeloyl-ACP methyl ester carboxylesterase [Actinomycetospora succinea]|uniref:Pimeloyl-ACP methyl ester carboxylesterase n=1 Tax=Actinomycetospora succinea TaxID=663603 RepID=A0A4R6V5F6_9PSEU|nr:alpha/beta hydrolase [Actinomycetospora succinea]TDQ54025.1 pimeloyl-ACP methyl ester carboxylesterase [Actinomycetospora succinea]